jgi:hypothetical protein
VETDVDKAVGLTYRNWPETWGPNSDEEVRIKKEDCSCLLNYCGVPFTDRSQQSANILVGRK